MTELLTRLFIRDKDNVQDPAVRQRYGALSGFTGICLNILLFLGKLIAGTVSGSIAITADAFNNLSDAGSSVVTLIGFRLAGQKPDRDHPFGHGRVEYLSGLAVSVVILLMGFELGKTSFQKILSPQPVDFSLLPLIILPVSILVKGWMYLFNRKLGKKIDSAAMMATAADSLSDMASTAVVLLGTLAGHFFRKDTIDPLLGRAPDPALVAGIRRLALAPPEILGLHDLIVHDYGPGRLFASLHAEVDKDDDISAIHDIIDTVERQIYHELGCEICIHMDPIAVGDKKTAECRIMAANLLAEIDPKLTMHDFRITTPTSSLMWCVPWTANTPPRNCSSASKRRSRRCRGVTSPSSPWIPPEYNNTAGSLQRLPAFSIPPRQRAAPSVPPPG